MRKLTYTLPNGVKRTLTYKNNYKYAIASTDAHVSLAIVEFYTLAKAQKRANYYNKTKGWTNWKVINVMEA
jgi:hypothetical protein